MYSHIINPKTNRKVSIKSRLGKNILKKYLQILSGGSVTMPPAETGLIQPLTATISTDYNFVDTSIFQQPIFYNGTNFFNILQTTINNIYIEADVAAAAKVGAAAAKEAENPSSVLEVLYELSGVDDNLEELSDWWFVSVLGLADQLTNYNRIQEDFPNLFILSGKPIRIRGIPGIRRQIQNILDGMVDNHTIDIIHQCIMKLFELINSHTDHIHSKNHLLEFILKRATTTGNTPVIAVGIGRKPGVVFNPMIIDDILCNDAKYDIYIVDRWSNGTDPRGRPHRLKHSTPHGGRVVSTQLWCFSDHRDAFISSNSYDITRLMNNLDNRFCSVMEHCVAKLHQLVPIHTTALVPRSCACITPQMKHNISIIPVESEFREEWIPYLAENIGRDKKIVFHDGMGGGTIQKTRLDKEQLVQDNSNLIILGTDDYLMNNDQYNKIAYTDGITSINQSFDLIRPIT